jgi:O-antigen ligase
MTSLRRLTHNEALQRKVVKALIIIGVPVLGFALVQYRSDTMMLAALAAVPLGLLAVTLLLRWPPLGLLAVVTVALIVPFDIPRVGTVAIMLAGLTAVWLGDMFMRQRRLVFVVSPTIPPLIMFTAVVILSFIIGQLPWFYVSQVPIDLQIGGAAIFILSFAAFFMAAHQIRDIKWLKYMVFGYIVLAIPSIIFGLRILPAQTSFRLNRMIYSAKITGGSLYWLWLATFIFSQILINKKLDNRLRIIMAVLLAGQFYLAMGRNRAWTSGWFPALVSLAIILVAYRPKLALPLTLGALLAGALGSQQIYDAVFIGDNEYSAITRLEAWTIVTEIAKKNPILGLGPGNYYNYTTLYSIRGWYVQFNSHNNYVDILAQTGILGIICFLWFAVVAGRLAWRLRTLVPKGGFTEAYVFGALGGLVGSMAAAMLGDWVLPFVFNIGIFGLRASIIFWLVMGGLVAIDQMLIKKIPIDD